MGLWRVASLLCMLIAACAANAEVWHVDAEAADGGDGTSWVTAFRAIGPALVAANSGDEVWVRAGTYDGAVVMKSGVALLGGFAGDETSSMGRDFTANTTVLRNTSFSAIVAYANVTSSLLEGFIVEGGAEPDENVSPVQLTQSLGDNFIVNTVIRNGRGGGVSSGGIGLEGSILTVLNCRFEDNETTGMGGAIRSTFSTLTVRQSHFENNRATFNGGAIHSTQTLLIEDCVFEENRSSRGGALSKIGGNVTIRRSHFRSNAADQFAGEGGALYARNDTLRVESCTFTGNDAVAYGGALYTDGVAATILNTIFALNSSSEGGAARIFGEGVSGINCTFALNNAVSAGGVSVFEATGSFRNSIFSEQDDVAVAVSGAGASASYQHCLFHNNAEADVRVDDNAISGAANIDALVANSTDNIDGDPLFRDAGAGDFHIRIDSPARGAANGAAAPAVDIDGDLRPGLDGMVDIGADEYTDMTPPQVLSITRIGLSPRNDGDAAFQVLFSEPVTGVDAGDFEVEVGGSLEDVSISAVVGSGSTWNVGLAVGAGDGTVSIDLIDDDSIVDTTGNALGGPAGDDGTFTEGEAFVMDRTAPVLTVLGADPAVLERGSFYIDEGASAIDAVDGDVSDRVVVGGAVDIGQVGVYTVTYVASDVAGNLSDASTRTVQIVDTVGPTIVLLGENPLNLEFGDEYVEPGATAFDSTDGDLSAEIAVETPQEFNGLGSYQFRYSVSDASGNTTLAIRVVNIVDTTAPVVSIIGDNPVVVNPGEPYTDAGATALDLVDGDLSGEIEVSGTVNTAVPGTYEITYAVTDASGNRGAAIREVIVQDRADFVVLPTVQYISAFARQVPFQVFNTRPVNQDWVAEIIEGSGYAAILSGASGTDSGVITVGVAENRTNERRDVVIRVSNAESKALLPIEVRVSQAPPAKAVGCGEGGGAGSRNGDVVILLLTMACIAEFMWRGRGRNCGFRA